MVSRTSQNDLPRHAGSWLALPSPDRAWLAVEACQQEDAEALSALVDAYLQWCHEGEGSVSPHTSSSYRHSVAYLLGLWPGQALLRPAPADLSRFQEALSASGMRLATQKARLSGVRALYRALRWAGAVTTDPLAGFQLPSIRSDPPTTRGHYSDDEREALLAAANPVDRALILLCADAGLRVSECVSLRWSDIDFTYGDIMLAPGSAGLARSVRMTSRLRETLESLLRRGDHVLGFTADVRARQRIQNLAERAGVPYRGVLALRRPISSLPTQSGADAQPGSELTAGSDDELSVARGLGSMDGVLIIHFDNLPEIGRLHGPSVASYALKALAARLTRAKRTYDVVTQVSQQDLAVTLSHLHSTDNLPLISSRLLRAASADPIQVHGLIIPIEASVRIHSSREDLTSLSEERSSTNDQVSLSSPAP